MRIASIIIVVGFVITTGAAAQDLPAGASAPSGAPQLPARLSGDVVIGSDFYGVAGAAARRPGAAWHASFTPQLTLIGSFTVGLDVLLSSEGSQCRQNMSQFGINPRYHWVTLHLGDFSQGYSSYTVQGSRVRGAGVDLRPGIFRFSVQGGQLQRAVAAGAGAMGYTRNLYAMSVGVGREQSSFLDVIVMHARDDTASLAVTQHDTLLLDTIPAALRPRYDVRPQENAVVGMQGQLQLLQQRLTLKGEGAMSLLTRDVASPAANPDSVSGGGTASGLMPLTLSSSGDYAWKLDGALALGAASVRAGYEYVGAGFNSLGLAYVINDRRSWTLGGSGRMLGGRLTLQGQFQHQNDNLLGQKVNTTNRDAIMGSAAMLITPAVTASLTAMQSGIANHALVDTFLVDNQAFAFTANTAVLHHLAGRSAVLSLSWALQTTHDGNLVTRIPDVSVSNTSVSWQVTLRPGLSVAPSVSYASTSSPGTTAQRNVFLGARAQARFGQLRTSFSATQTYSGSRGVFTVMGQGSVPLAEQARLSLQLRHSRYGAIGARPAFQESFATISLARSF